MFTRQSALKLGYFYWLRVKNSKHTKFFLERKASLLYSNKQYCFI